MHHEFLKHHHPASRDFHASRFFAVALLIMLVVGMLAALLFSLFGAADIIADHRITLWLGSLLIGLITSSYIFDRYETLD